MESTGPKEASSSLHDAIVTLPKRTFFLLVAVGSVALGAALWIAAEASSDEIKSAAAHAVVVMLPLMIAIIAAGGIRRTSTRQVDALVDGFLHETVYERFHLWCHTGKSAKPPYPFRKVERPAPPQGRSYADFRFHWRDLTLAGLPPADVGVKMNVFNFEVLTSFNLRCPVALLAGATLGNIVIDKHTLDASAAHPLLKMFFGTIQGSLEEGYAVRVTFGTPQSEGGIARLSMLVSLRQKLGVNFLTSPFLKRYFAEDAAIVVGVLYRELIASGLMADDAA
jgi:hypothetical protein